ncbi:unnamed protein product [Echinostoma caproni]|uniref:Brix domain-containing protein n=1 Tax=Echinostoma caproni TaxID=27848 RepID=A0A183BBY0_9TREM|nr:unnamed protein product [Echinostoma caproni]
MMWKRGICSESLTVVRFQSQGPGANRIVHQLFCGPGIGKSDLVKMTESAQSDTTSDSDFDEQDLTVEDEDEDSIAPEEDVADEEEVNSLVKVSSFFIIFTC